MKLSKKGKKGVRIKKLANGGNGNGDRVKEATATPPKIVYLDSDENAIVAPGTQVIRRSKDDEQESFIPYDMPASGRIESTPLVDLVVALGAGSLGAIARGIQGVYGYLSGVPLLSMEGTTMVSAANALDIYGGAAALEYGPDHFKDFIEDPSLSTGAWLGLDMLGLFSGGSAAKQVYTNALKVNPIAKNPMSFTSALNLGDEAIVATKVNEASVAFNKTVKEEITKISGSGLTSEEKKKAIQETMKFYDDYLNNPDALEMLVSHRNFTEGAKVGNFSRGVPMSPVIADDAASQAYIYTKSKPYYATRSTEGQALGLGAKPVRNLSIIDDGTGSPNVKVDYFSNTSQGRRNAAEALIENYRSGSQSVRNAIETTIDDMRRQFGTSARGVTTAFENITGQVKMIDGIPVTSGDFAYDLSAQQIKFLNEGSYEQILNTLIHETNHNMLQPFLNQTADMQIVEMHLIGATNRVAAFPGQRPGRSLVEGFHKIDDMVPEIENIGQKYAALDPNLNAAGVENYVMELLLPDETLARLFEIKHVYSKIAAKQGIKNNDWMYNFTPETARQALQAWKSTKDAPIEADIFLDIMQGSDRSSKLRTLSSLLNETFTPMPVAVAGSAAATQAIISDEETPTINKRGGFISRKKRRKGYRSI